MCFIVSELIERLEQQESISKSLLQENKRLQSALQSKAGIYLHMLQ